MLKSKTILQAMKKSTVAHGKRAKSSVFRGTKVKTGGGLQKADLKKNSKGKVVSKKASAAATKRANKSGFSQWGIAVKKAHAKLGLKGFVACKKGTVRGHFFQKFIVLLPTQSICCARS